MRALREDERDEIESIKYLVKFALCKHDITDNEILSVLNRMNKMSRKYLTSGLVDESELNELLDLEDMQAFIQKFNDRILPSLMGLEKDD